MILSFTDKQKETLKKFEFEFNPFGDLSDDQIADLQETVGDILILYGLDDKGEITELGDILYEILDNVLGNT